MLPTSAFDHMVEWWLGVSKAHARHRDGLSVLILAPQAEGGGWSGSWLDHQLMLLVGLCVLGLVFAANLLAVTLGAEYLLGVSVDALPLGNRILLGTLPMFLVAVEIYATVKLKLTG